MEETRNLGTLGQTVWHSGCVEGESGPRNIHRWGDHELRRGGPGTLGQIAWDSGYNRDVEGGKVDPEISGDGVTTGLRV